MRTAQRGFYCRDLTIRYPYHECTITVPMLLVLVLLLPLLFISIVEIMRICKHFRMRQYMGNLWRNLGLFSFGFVATYLTTELAKHVVGRLRPHFYAACLPRLNDGTSCDDAQNHELYIEHYHCTNRNLSARQLRELHVSFPSAHSSLAFYAMCLLAFYVHNAWQGRGSCRVLRHILQFLLLMLAWYIALSRVADYWHHWSDVLAGAVLGILYACITAIYVGDLLRLRVGTTSNNSSKPKSHAGYTAAPTCINETLTDNNNCQPMETAIEAATKVHFFTHDCDCKSLQQSVTSMSSTTVLPNLV